MTDDRWRQLRANLDSKGPAIATAASIRELLRERDALAERADTLEQEVADSAFALRAARERERAARDYWLGVATKAVRESARYKTALGPKTGAARWGDKAIRAICAAFAATPDSAAAALPHEPLDDVPGKKADDAGGDRGM